MSPRSDESSEYQLLSGVRSAFGDGPGAVTTELLGAPDAVLQGGGWEVPVHRYVVECKREGEPHGCCTLYFWALFGFFYLGFFIVCCFVYVCSCA